VICTTNAIESLNSVIRKSVKTRKNFPNGEAAMKIIYLATAAAAKKMDYAKKGLEACAKAFDD